MGSLTKLFCKLCTIPSPSGREQDVAKYIQNQLEIIEVGTRFDNSGKLNDSNSGNLIAKLHGRKSKSTILFVAHMDTVEDGVRRIKPIVKNGVITSKGDTVLGADNKASVACLIEVLKEIKSWKSHPIIIVVFTTREEKGKMGSRMLKLNEKIDYAFNVDGRGPPGTFIYQTLGETPFTIEIQGKPSHAAISPEKGINAVKAAANIISRLTIGKDEEGNILNIGTIKGGTKDNVVPDKAMITGQVRSYSGSHLKDLLNKVENLVANECKKIGCKYTFGTKTEEGAPPASISKNHEMLKIAKNATEKVGLHYTLTKGSFTSDANFIAKYYDVLSVCRGGENPHGYDETITEKELNDLKELLIQLVKEVNK